MMMIRLWWWYVCFLKSKTQERKSFLFKKGIYSCGKRASCSELKIANSHLTVRIRMISQRILKGSSEFSTKSSRNWWCEFLFDPLSRGYIWIIILEEFGIELKDEFKVCWDRMKDCNIIKWYICHGSINICYESRIIDFWSNLHETKYCIFLGITTILKVIRFFPHQGYSDICFHHKRIIIHIWFCLEKRNKFKRLGFSHNTRFRYRKVICNTSWSSSSFRIIDQENSKTSSSSMTCHINHPSEVRLKVISSSSLFSDPGVIHSDDHETCMPNDHIRSLSAVNIISVQINY